ncbi:hypothetical protein [Psychromonas sp. MME2]|uniref:hypothetical protein n=1 Tax=unclassified Psychromonas TaxID=2614957 RepID=UPI00339CA898
MNKIILFPLLAIGLTGCGSSSTETPAPQPPPVEEPNTPITDIARNGYKALSYDPSDVQQLPVPAAIGEGKNWVEVTAMSDDFTYDFSPRTEKTYFGENDKWYNFYHADWDGPGSTYWKHDHVSVKDGNLAFKVSRSASSGKQDKPGVDAGVISSARQVVYPAYVEASVSLPDVSLAAAVWLLSPDDTQEIDIIEAYPGAENGNDYFSELIHLSHHSFIRKPFTDYQPRDINSWWKSDIHGFASWGDFGWNSGDRQYIQVGTYWISPFHFEYYIDGELVRVLYKNAFASKINDQWHYTYPAADNGHIIIDKGYQVTEEYAVSDEDFSFATLKAASAKSTLSVIDPYSYQSGKGFYKPADIIINMELQSWWEADPTDQQLANESGKTTMLVDWIRVYKPK